MGAFSCVSRLSEGESSGIGACADPWAHFGAKCPGSASACFPLGFSHWPALPESLAGAHVDKGGAMRSYSYSVGGMHPHDPISREELVAGMQLMRAVSMQSTRFQLAVMRKEQRPALESLDRLGEMDRELEHFIEAIGGAAEDMPELAPISDMVARQKQALDSEKLALMSGVSGPGVVGLSADRDEADAGDDLEDEEAVAPPPRRGRLLTATGVILSLAALGAAFFYYRDVMALHFGI
ncbi:hypothetical protein [Sphingomonas sp. C3-2]|uniref:hypothetical protein n=1 Tax=Sphingomonas sp. C3-2 TaxID=3062169 RepID=UPI00294B5EC8|nr:hypothetical protein [Sphingomonas sp. C3-2]WOK37334.1 hypothetical protein QYC26_03855 [Sphingomonas sp. C3-2]